MYFSGKERDFCIEYWSMRMMTGVLQLAKKLGRQDV